MSRNVNVWDSVDSVRFLCEYGQSELDFVVWILVNKKTPKIPIKTHTEADYRNKLLNKKATLLQM